MKVTDITPNFHIIQKKLCKRGKYDPLAKLATKNINGVEYALLKYTHAAQQSRAWFSERFTQEEKDVLTWARGVVYNTQTDEIVALPFLKFHNFDTLVELNDVPNCGFTVYDKVDGNLVVLAHYAGDWQVTSSGSFESPVINTANLMGDKYANIIEGLDKRLTYLFEIIAPNLRIIVDYGIRFDLTLIGAFVTETGEEVDIEEIDFPNKPEKIEGLNTLDEVVQKAKYLVGSEGFIIKWDNGVRAKVKGDWYLRMDGAMNGINANQIWNILSWKNLEEVETKMAEFMEKVPNELLAWVENRIAKFHQDYQELMEELKFDLNQLGGTPEARHIAIGQLEGDKRKFKDAFYKLNKGFEPHLWGYLKPKNVEKPTF